MGERQLLLGSGRDSVWVQDRPGEGLPLVLLHPGIADSRIWDRLLPLLPGRRVVRLDQRGFGRSAYATEGFDALSDLVDVLDALGLGQVHLVGNSMGGAVALALALADPARVRSLTLLAPGIGGYPWPDSTPEDEALQERYDARKAARDVEGIAEIFGGLWCAQGVDEHLREQLVASVHADLAQAEHEEDLPAQWDGAATLSTPTTVVACELDPAESVQASLDLAAQIPGAELVRLRLDHLPQYRDPAAVAAVAALVLARAD